MDNRRTTAAGHEPAGGARSVERWVGALPRQLAPRLAAAIVVTVFLGFCFNVLVRVVYAGGGVFDIALCVALFAGLLAAQLWYVTGIVDSRRSRTGLLVLGAQACLAYLPLLHFGIDWVTMAAFVAAGALLVLPGRAAVPVVVAVVVGSAALEYALHPALTYVLGLFYTPVALTSTALGLYAVSRFARLVVAAEEARAELAKMAVAQERLRVARDLHDLLGYSLSAISLKTELSRRLLAQQPARAAAELAEVLDVSRQALTDVRAVASGYRELSLDAEARSARAVLLAADVDVTMDLRYEHVPTPVGTVLATVLREGVTNVLRHSKAEHVTISIADDGGEVRMEIDNDGVTRDDEPVAGGNGNGNGNGRGNGIGNLAARVAAHHGRLEAVQREPRHYRLAVTIPVRRVDAR